MRYERLGRFPEGLFRRLTGIKPKTFEKMVEVLRVSERKVRCRGGKKCSLCVADRLLMLLEYWREYRTYSAST